MSEHIEETSAPVKVVPPPMEMTPAKPVSAQRNSEWGRFWTVLGIEALLVTIAVLDIQDEQLRFQLANATASSNELQGEASGLKHQTVGILEESHQSTALFVQEQAQVNALTDQVNALTDQVSRLKGNEQTVSSDSDYMVYLYDKWVNDQKYGYPSYTTNADLKAFQEALQTLIDDIGTMSRAT